MIVFGNLGCNPIIRKNKRNQEYYCFHVAENFGSGNRKKTRWYQVSFYGDPSQVKDLKKSDSVRIEGFIEFKKNAEGQVMMDTEGNPIMVISPAISIVKHTFSPKQRQND